MRPVHPVTPAEFFHHLQRCIPPTGWLRKIAVANSGGPDSTALLYLLNAVVQERRASDKHGQIGLPQEITSIHVNHNLQDAAPVMAKTAENTATRLHVPHTTEVIPWGKPPFPLVLTVDESVARDARYNKLFYSMRRARTKVIAFAHHADDQVETSLMRMSQGSGMRGLAAMRAVRRWGMGERDKHLANFGIPGMDSWIVRPLLHVPKGRLLATCDAYKLHYVNDPTNFQPDLTLRNSVRRILSGNAQIPPNEALTDVAQKIRVYADELRPMVPDVRPADQLREAVRLYGLRIEEIDSQVTNVLGRARLPSAPSTLLLRSAVLDEVTDQEVRFALIRRCLRFASHGPWGSVWSEVSGHRDTLGRAAAELWPTKPEASRRTFTAGAGVIVYPVAIRRRDGTIRFRECAPGEDSEEPGWVFARAPPYEQAGAPAEAYAVQDVTAQLLDAREKGEQRLDVLYDRRFRISFNLERMWPLEVEEPVWETKKGRIVIQPDTKWVLPRVVLLSEGADRRTLGRYIWYLKGWKDAFRGRTPRRWFDMDFVRTLDAV